MRLRRRGSVDILRQDGPSSPLLLLGRKQFLLPGIVCVTYVVVDSVCEGEEIKRFLRLGSALKANLTSEENGQSSRNKKKIGLFRQEKNSEFSSSLNFSSILYKSWRKESYWKNRTVLKTTIKVRCGTLLLSSMLRFVLFLHFDLI
jgi:hypothetical protein